MRNVREMEDQCSRSSHFSLAVAMKTTDSQPIDFSLGYFILKELSDCWYGRTKLLEGINMFPDPARQLTGDVGTGIPDNIHDRE